MEKRSNPRRRISRAIACIRFGWPGDDRSIAGRIRNCSSSGFCAELTEWVRPGTMLVIRPSGASGGHADAPHQPPALAEVRWAQPDHAGGDARFATGLKYLPIT
jgi:hypothetical protein